jgi:hypothetical protein
MDGWTAHEIAIGGRRPISSVDASITNANANEACARFDAPSLASDDAFWNPSRMHRSPRLTVLLASVLLAASGVATLTQSPVDFSGTWIVEPTTRGAGVERGAAPPALSAQGDMGSGWGSEMTITQDDSSLTVVYTYFHPRDMHPPFTFTYPLNGVTARHTVNMGRGPQEQLSKALWRGATILIATTHRFVNPADGQTLTSDMSQVLSLESPETMVIETTRFGVAGGAPSTTRTVYRKKKS